MTALVGPAGVAEPAQRAGDPGVRGWRRTGRRGGSGCGRSSSLAAAAAFGFAPAVVNSLVGHVTMAFAPALPVLVALSVDAWRGREGWSPRRTGLVLGGVATAQVFVGEEVLFQAGLARGRSCAVVAALSRPAGGPPRAPAGWPAPWRGPSRVFLPITAYPLYLQFFGGLSHHGNPFLKDYYARRPHGFTTPTDRLWLHGADDAAKAAKFPGRHRGAPRVPGLAADPHLRRGDAVAVAGRRPRALRRRRAGRRGGALARRAAVGRRHLDRRRAGRTRSSRSCRSSRRRWPRGSACSRRCSPASLLGVAVDVVLRLAAVVAAAGRGARSPPSACCRCCRGR